jgi:DNA polymerase III subunit gamma/tau
VSYQVIARKYRPQRFADVVGQEHVTQTLANAIKSGRIAHAYLFCGPRGTGKTTLARIFAKCLNCTGGPAADFPDDDPRVREITEGRSLDVLEIDGASNNGVDQVRELRETARFAPAAGKFKIYIIDEVHMLSTAAFNALLKTLEEPPAHVKFLFATTDPEKVLPTILSRCQRFDLRRIPAALIVAQLARIAQAENVQIEDAALSAIARRADGGMRDAQSTLDQLISFCGERIVEGDVLGMFGLAARAQLLELGGALLAGEAETALRGLDTLARGGKDLGRLLGDLLNHFRNLLLFQVSRGDRSLLEVSEAELGALQSQAARIETEPLTRVMEVLSAAEGRLRDAASKRIFLEVTLLKAIQARGATSLDTVLRQLTTLRDGLSAEAAAAPAPAPIRTPVPAAEPPPPPAAAVAPLAAQPPSPAPQPPPPSTSPVAAMDLASLWPALLGQLGPADGMLRASLTQCAPVSYERGLLTVSHPADVLVDTAKNVASLKIRLQQLTGQPADVRFVDAPAPAGGSPAAAPAATPRPAASPTAPKPVPPAKPVPQTLSKEDFLNDPLIRDALEIFRGTIVEVRGPEPADA